MASTMGMTALQSAKGAGACKAPNLGREAQKSRPIEKKDTSFDPISIDFAKESDSSFVHNPCEWAWMAGYKSRTKGVKKSAESTMDITHQCSKPTQFSANPTGLQ